MDFQFESQARHNGQPTHPPNEVWSHVPSRRSNTASFRPLSALLTEPVAPELLYMEAKWSSLLSYGLSLDALKDFLPIALSLDVKTCAMTRSRWLSDWKRS